jgi:hypothetical protein
VKRLAVAAVAAGTLTVLAALAPAQAAQLCLTADVDINGNAQSIEQCLPE